MRNVTAGTLDPPARRKPKLQRLRVIAALILREMAASYGRSWGGYVWAIAEPAASILLLALIFSLALAQPALGTSFALFYATGVIPYYLFNAVTTAVGTAVQANRGLLTYPVVSALDTVIARMLLEVMTFAAVAAFLLPLIVIFDRAVIQLDLLAVVIAMALATVLGLGMGLMNAVVFAYWPTWRNIWAVLRRPLFLGSGIMFVFSAVPQPFQDWLWWNPLIHIIGQMRMGFYATYDGDYINWFYVLLVALGLTAVFGFLLRRNEGAIVER
jgi:capsular polysaccharide transport system permease protein